MSRDNDQLNGMDIRFGGRTVRFEVYVNTDATDDQLHVLCERIKSAAAGERIDMTVVAASRVKPAEAIPLWMALIAGSKQQIADENEKKKKGN